MQASIPLNVLEYDIVAVKPHMVVCVLQYRGDAFLGVGPGLKGLRKNTKSIPAIRTRGIELEILS